MAAFKAYVMWFPRKQLPLINGLQMAAGGLGALSCDLDELRLLPRRGGLEGDAHQVPGRAREGPGPALAGCRLAHTPHRRLGFPVLRRSPLYMHAVATTPAEPLGARIARFPSNSGLPRNSGGSASALPFSRPAQRSLLVRPACSQNH